LGPNEYVLIGACYDRPDTLGHRCFIGKEPPNPAQRLLVIRTGRAPECAGITAGAAESDESLPPTQEAPLAFQAFYTAARGYPP
jgi:hypothetical protein